MRGSTRATGGGVSKETTWSACVRTARATTMESWALCCRRWQHSWGARRSPVVRIKIQSILCFTGLLLVLILSTNTLSRHFESCTREHQSAPPVRVIRHPRTARPGGAYPLPRTHRTSAHRSSKRHHRAYRSLRPQPADIHHIRPPSPASNETSTPRILASQPCISRARATSFRPPIQRAWSARLRA